MKDLIAKHPDMEELITLYPQCHTYKILAEDGSYKEYWKRNKAGHWVDITEAENLKIAIRKEKENLEKLRKAELAAQKKAVKEAQK